MREVRFVANKWRLLWMVIFLTVSVTGFAQTENCNNGIDDDGDGKIDLNDNDCLCNVSSVPSVIPNPSFEDYSECPTSFSQLNMATSWHQATDATSDYFNHCYYVMPGIAQSPLNEFPDGDGIVGALFINDWKEYIGTVLPTPLNQGTNYQLTFNVGFTQVDGSGGWYPPEDHGFFETVFVTLYGKATPTTFPVPTTFSPDTYDNAWKVLGQAAYTPSEQWGEITLLFTPETDIRSVMIGPPTVMPLTYTSPEGWLLPYFVFDNLRLNEASHFGVNITTDGFYCVGDLTLQANLTTEMVAPVSYQWYLNGIAISGANQSTFDITPSANGTGVYAVRVTDANGCYVSTTTVTDILPGPEFTLDSPDCIVPTGSITVTTPAQEYSFDNGLTWQTSPVKNDLPVGFYYIKIRNGMGCISAVSGVLISEPNLLPGSAYTVEQPDECGDTGSITILATEAAEFSFDNGATWTENATASGLTSGYYSIRIRDENGCMSAAQAVWISEFQLPVPSFDYIPPACPQLGSITITTEADFYSFDGGLTWVNSNFIENLPPGTYNIKTMMASGCESPETYVYLGQTVFLDTPEVELQSPSCNQTGTITITTSAAAYSFDGGLTWGTSNSLSGLAPGYYAVSIMDENGCVSHPYNGFYLSEDIPPTPPFQIIHPFCLETTGRIVFDPQPGYTYSFDGGITFQPSNDSGDLPPGSYTVLAQDQTNCVSQYAYAYISSPSGIPAAPNGSDTQFFCIHNSPTVSFLQASGDNIRWYASGNPVALTPDTPLQSGTYLATQTTAEGCESPDVLTVQVSVGPYSIPVQNYATDVCDTQNNGSETIDLTDFASYFISDPENHTFSYHSSFAAADAFLSFDPITNFTAYPLSGPATIFVRVVAANGCWGVSRLDLDLVPVPVNAMPVHYILCEHHDVTLTADPGFDHYLWSTGETSESITVTSEGTYTVTVTNDFLNASCSQTISVEVQLSNPATIVGFETFDWTQNQNSFAVNATGFGDYEYSLDDIFYQDSPVFNQLLAGEHTIYVRDKHGCGISTDLVQLLMYPLFFTPNGDQLNDNWQIKFSWNEPDMLIYVFDRYGKLLKQFSPNSLGWDGTYNGKAMPSDDYWFLVERSRGNYTGHFTLKR